MTVPQRLSSSFRIIRFDCIAQRSKRIFLNLKEYKPFMWVVGGAVALMLCIAALADHVLIGNFKQLEQQDVLAKIGQVERALATDLNQIAAFNRDYAEWNDAFEFVKDRAPDFPDSNFVAETLAGMVADVVWIADADGKDLYSGILAGEGLNARIITPAPQQILATLRPLRTQTSALRARPSTERLLHLDGRLAAFSGMEITNSEGTVSSGAVMFFARFVNAGMVQRISETSALPAELLLPNSTSVIRNAELTQWARSANAKPAMLPLSDADQVSGVAMLRELNGSPAIILRTHVDRDILTTGKRNTWAMVTAVAGLVLAFVIATCLMLRRLQRNTREHNESLERYQRVIASLEESVLIACADTGRIMEANQALLRTAGYSAVELVSQQLDNIFIDYDRLCDAARHSNNGSSAASGECRIRTRDGRLIDSDVTLTELHHSGKRLLCLVARDITIRKQAERQREEHRLSLEHQAHHDPLTGLPNRLYFKSQLSTLLDQAIGQRQKIALLYIDLDDFKGVNDSKGHAGGDELLRISAQRLRSCVAARDTVIRMGGDEFVILAQQMPDRAAAEAVAQRVVHALREPMVIDGTAFNISGSVGIGLYPDDGLDLDSLLRHADIALYEAKSAGRDTFRFFDANMNIGRGERVALQQALRHAIGTRQIEVEFQPVMDLHTGLLSSFEALARWRHPEMGLIAPSRFIGVAEQSGLIDSLGRQILGLVCQQLSNWSASGLSLRPVAINVSPLQLERSDFADQLRRIAGEHAVDLGLLHIEVTESTAMEDNGRHTVALRKLRDLGCKILIDDFGTGYSSLSQLKNLPLDFLKIDREFVSNMSSDANDAAIVAAIVSMAHSLGLAVVAEGIESAEQLLLLQGLGCQFGQGYHFSPPVSSLKCVAMLEQAARNKAPSDSLRIRQLRMAQQA